MITISDVEEDTQLPFRLGSSENENCFEIFFQDGDSVVMEFVKLDRIVDDMIGIWEAHQETYQQEHSTED